MSPADRSRTARSRRALISSALIEPCAAVCGSDAACAVVSVVSCVCEASRFWPSFWAGFSVGKGRAGIAATISGGTAAVFFSSFESSGGVGGTVATGEAPRSITSGDGATANTFDAVKEASLSSVEVWRSSPSWCGNGLEADVNALASYAVPPDTGVTGARQRGARSLQLWQPLARSPLPRQDVVAPAPFRH